MAKYVVLIGNTPFNVEAPNKYRAKLSAARAYVRKYPNANIDTRKVLTQYKIRVRKA